MKKDGLLAALFVQWQGDGYVDGTEWKGITIFYLVWV